MLEATVQVRCVYDPSHVAPVTCMISHTWRLGVSPYRSVICGAHINRHATVTREERRSPRPGPRESQSRGLPCHDPSRDRRHVPPSRHRAAVMNRRPGHSPPGVAYDVRRCRFSWIRRVTAGSRSGCCLTVIGAAAHREPVSDRRPTWPSTARGTAVIERTFLTVVTAIVRGTFI